MDDFRHIRSWLFVPGDSERKLAKSWSSGADALIVDLEDSVTAENKAEARRTAGRAIIDAREAGATLPIVIRLNAETTGLLEDDVAATLPARPDAYVVPKIADAGSVANVVSLLRRLEAEQDIARPVPIIPIATEVPGAVFHLKEIACADSRVRGLFWGMEDLGAEMGARRTRGLDGRILEPFRVVRAMALFAATHAGIACVDTPSIDLDNSPLLEEEATEASWTGFTGKLAIHPSQVAAINAAFSPTPDEVEDARMILRLSREGGGAAFRHKGRMVDTPHLVAAEERLLARLRAA